VGFVAVGLAGAAGRRVDENAAEENSATTEELLEGAK
jgi:hypothetical protein